MHATKSKEMKILWIVLATVFLANCHSAGSQSSSKPKFNTTPETKNSKTFIGAETGLSFALQPNWRMDDDTDDNSQRTWRGPNNTRFFVMVMLYTPKAGNRSIEEEMKNFYEAHEGAGEEDLRYLEVDGVNGVHYLRDEKGWDQNYQPQDQRFITWVAQRLYKGKRQTINITLSSPSRNFAKDRETLYWLLQSIRFRREEP
jgi:hypothetical protein